jgi:signal transduction histidine kinase
MSIDQRLRRRLSRRALIGVGAPILALVLLVVAGACVVFVHFAQNQDRAYADNTRRLVANTLEGRLRGLSDLTLDFASWNDAYAAITVRWNSAWVRNNFYSAVADGLVVFHEDGALRHVWLPDWLQAQAQTLPAEMVQAARAVPGLTSLIRAPHAAGTVTRGLVMLDGRLGVLSAASIAPEDDAERLRRAASTPVDYVVAVDILDDRQIAEIGRDLDVQDLALVAQPPAPSPDIVSLPLRAANGDLLGYLRWRNQRPGDAGLAAEIGPVLLMLFLIGAFTFLIARSLMLRQVGEAARMQAAMETSRLKSEFIANMSHELRTPLNVIIGYAELIQEETPAGEANESVRADAGCIVEAAGKLRQLIDDVLDHSRIDAGRLRLAPEPIDVPQLLAEIEDLMAPTARANGNALLITSDADASSLVSDHQRLRQCLVNLIDNAIRCTRDGAVSVAARSSIVGGAPHVVFEIQDTGVGISGANPEQLFEPFGQGDGGAALDQKRGTGLGLSIARKLARAMGGEVTFVSEPGVGSCFRLTMPAAPAAA